ncbi:MAG: YjiH family protein [Clostridium sp.]
MLKTEKATHFKWNLLLLFLIPSIIGVLFFMTPVPNNGELTIPVAILSRSLLNRLVNVMPYIVCTMITLAALGTFITKIAKPAFIINNKFFNTLFNISPVWAISRFLGMIFVISATFKIGPNFIWSENTGGLLLYDLLPILFSVFLFAGLFLPLLLNFGLLEFVGTFLSKVMRPIFKLPGRSSIDCITSWLGDGTIGVLLTSKQYEEGYYSSREASIISTSFSAVSITFSLVVIAQVGLSNLFVPFYLTVTLCGVVLAIIVPRIPPLSRKTDTFYNDVKKENKEVIPENHSTFSWALTQALDRAEKNKNFGEFLWDGVKNVLDMWLGVLPIVMSIGTIALIIAEYTPVFQILGMPFIPILNLLQIPEAAAASQTLIVGFADMFLPTVIGATIASPLTRFVIACISVVQLIYMSEIGGLILGSKIPVSLKELFIIFLERTLISLPIIALIGHILF